MSVAVGFELGPGLEGDFGAVTAQRFEVPVP
jgi:hypothetical protein